ncbi:MAG TPA: hypothetical protein DCM31_02185 [Deferribacteraceae bacterium]|nr:hypothetical protein [Deferribacteraceae bacterium]
MLWVYKNIFTRSKLLLDGTPIYIGTSGYKHDDWVGTLYPQHLKNEQFLDYYANSFGLNFVEITYPFYAIPTVETTERIAENGGDSLHYSVRLFKDFLKERLDRVKVREFKEGIKPLLDTGRVKCWLADFHHTFKPSKENLERILRLRDSFSELPFFAELPRGWHREKQIDDLRNNAIGLVVADMPRNSNLPPFIPCAPNQRAYFRLYGRNKKWVLPAKKVLDYSYVKPELQEIKDGISTVTAVSKEVFVSFCNVAKAQGAFNAKYFARMAEESDESL